MEKSIKGKIAKPAQFSPIQTETGINKQPDQSITSGMVQSPVAGMNTPDVFAGQNLEPYGMQEKPTERDLSLKRSSGATKGLSIDLATTGKQGEKAK